MSVLADESRGENEKGEKGVGLRWRGRGETMVRERRWVGGWVVG